jgi:hypothetical protein
MTNLINQITINGETTTFLNYVNPVVNGESVSLSTVGALDGLFTSRFGVASTIWTRDSSSTIYNVKFPVTWETIGTGIVGNIAAVGANFPNNSTRVVFNSNICTPNISPYNNIGAEPRGYLSLDGVGTTNKDYCFAVLNRYSLAIAAFSNSTRSVSTISYMGWMKGSGSGGIYTGTQYPRNFVVVAGDTNTNPWTSFNVARVSVENTTTKQNLLRNNPTFSCSIATAGANSTDVIIRDSASPNNYIGKLWNMMVLPSTAVVGKIYKNTGIDPDTGAVETDQKAYWMCVGTWGTDKIGMRVWTEGIS